MFVLSVTMIELFDWHFNSWVFEKIMNVAVQIHKIDRFENNRYLSFDCCNSFEKIMNDSL